MTATLAVRPALRPAPRLAPEPLAGPVLRLVEPSASPGTIGQAVLDLEFAGPGPPTTGPADGPGLLAPRLLQAVVEVLDGRRSPVVLQRAVTADVLGHLTRLVPRGPRPGRQQRPPAVVRLRTAAPRPGVCECAAVVVIGGRPRAVAARLSHRGDVWVLDALEVG